MSRIAWQAAVNTSRRFESRRIVWIVVDQAPRRLFREERLRESLPRDQLGEHPAARPGRVERAMSIQFLKISRPVSRAWRQRS